MLETDIGKLTQLRYSDLRWQLFTPGFDELREQIGSAYINQSTEALAASLVGNDGKLFSKCASVMIQEMEDGSFYNEFDPQLRALFYSRVAEVDNIAGNNFREQGIINRRESHYFLHASENAALAAREFFRNGRHDEAFRLLEISRNSSECLAANAKQRGDAKEELHAYVNAGYNVNTAFRPWFDKLRAATNIPGLQDEKGDLLVNLIPADYMPEYSLDFYNRATPYILWGAETNARAYSLATDLYDGENAEGFSEKLGKFWGLGVITQLEALTRNFSFFYMREVQRTDTQGAEMVDPTVLARYFKRGDFVDLSLAMTTMGAALIAGKLYEYVSNVRASEDHEIVDLDKGGILSALHALNIMHQAMGLELGVDIKDAPLSLRLTIDKLLRNERLDSIAISRGYLAKLKEQFTKFELGDLVDALLKKHHQGLDRLSDYAKPRRRRSF